MEVINLQNVNIETLPISIKNEFEIIYFEFNNTEHKPIHIHSVINTILNYKNKNILLNNANEDFTDEDFVEYLNRFNTGFNEGYLIAKEYIDDATELQIKTDRVFSGVYKKLNILKETHTFLMKSDNGKYLFEEMDFYNHGIEVGKYVMCWDYILNNHNWFNDVFDFHFTKPKTIPTEAIPENKQKTNKSLMFKSAHLNIKDRYRILNKVLDFDKKVHPLNIGELEKYQLLSYILGIDKDNARKLMNGSHHAKDNDLTSYFDELGLNK